jgi:hypothetical protein
MAEGDVLYRDVASLYGPLSQAVNGFFFSVAGAGHSTLLVANLALLAGATALLTDLCLRLADRRAATLCAVLFLSVFGFAHLTPLGNYNFITPYAHEATHGSILCLLTVWGLCRWLATGSRSAAAVAGLAAGAAWLTKPEIALAATLSLGAGLALARGTPAAEKRSALWIVAACLVIPAATAWAAAAPSLGAGGASAALLTPFTAAVAADPLSQAFYRNYMGLDDSLGNLARMLAAGGAGLAVYLLAARMGARVPRGARVPLASAVAAMLVIATLATGQWRLWLGLAWILPGACVLTLYALWTTRPATPTEAAVRASLVAWLVLSCVLLIKLGLKPRFYHYGFYLAMPATLLLVILSTHLAPLRLGGSGWDASSARVLSGALLTGLAVVLGLSSVSSMMRRTFEIGMGRDRMWVRPPESDPRTGSLAELVERLASGGDDPFSTMAVLPEGALLNFWLRTPASTPYPVLLPPELEVYGEETVLSAFKSRAPDLIVSLDRDMSEYAVEEMSVVPGAPRLSAWLEVAYCVVGTKRSTAADGRTHAFVLRVPREGAACSR